MSGALLRAGFAETLCGLFALAAVAVLARLLGRRAPALRHALWGLVLLRLVLPPDLAQPWSLSAIVSGRLSGTIEWALPGWLGREIGGGNPAGREPSAVPEGGGVARTWETALLALWLVGALFGGARFVRLRRRFRRSVVAARAPVPEGLAELVEGFRRRLGIGRPVVVVVGGAEVSPFTYGVLRPVIYLPRSIARAGSAAVAAVVAHELAHVRRADDLRLLGEAALRSLWFFHPAAWIAARARRRERERLADRLVLERGLLSPTSYGRGVVAALSLRLRPAPGVAAFLPTQRRRSLMRLEDILSPVRRRPTRPGLALATALVAGAFLLPMASPGGAAAADRPAELANPVPGARVTSPFGERYDPIAKARGHHDGIDLGAAPGTPILAPAAGVVRVATERWEGGEHQGTVVLLDHGGGLVTFYAHLASLAVHPGERVTQGEVLGRVGATGAVTGPHLHFEVRDGGRAVDPARFVSAWRVAQRR